MDVVQLASGVGPTRYLIDCAVPIKMMKAEVGVECGKKSGVESQVYDLSRQGRKDLRFRIAAYWGLE